MFKLDFYLSILFIIAVYLSGIEGINNKLTMYTNEDNICCRVNRLLNKASTDITISVYSLDDIHIVNTLNRLSIYKGVKITIFVGNDIPDRLLLLLNDKIKIKKINLSSGLYHHKVIIIDNKYVLIGSSNLTPTSLHKHFNDIFIFESHKIAKYLNSAIRSLSNGSNIFNYYYSDVINVNGCEYKIDVAIMPYGNEYLIYKYKEYFLNKNSFVISFSYTNKYLDSLFNKSSILVNRPSNISNGDRFSINKSNKVIHNKLSFNKDVYITGSPNHSSNALYRNSEIVCIVSPNPFMDKASKYFNSTKIKVLKKAPLY